MKLCYCNNCETIYEDMNPQVEAKEYPETNSFEPLQWVTDKDDGEACWLCPKCRTDGYLRDEISEDLYKD